MKYYNKPKRLLIGRHLELIMAIFSVQYILLFVSLCVIFSQVGISGVKTYGPEWWI
jgi:hypothetical protein